MRKISELILEKASREKHLQEEKNRKEYAETFAQLLNEFNALSVEDLKEEEEQAFYEKLKSKLKKEDKKEEDLNEKIKDEKKLHDLAISFIDFYGGEIPETLNLEKKAIDFLDRLGVTDKNDQIQVWDYARTINENP